nr:hypothetical protein [Kibdelosporangium sp. MJ126-NF4]
MPGLASRWTRRSADMPDRHPPHRTAPGSPQPAHHEGTSSSVNAFNTGAA